MKKISYLATMLATLFVVACTSNDIPADPDSNVQGDRVLKINIEKLATKTEHPGAADQSYTKVEDGVIYFFKSDGGAVYAYRLTANDITTLEGANTSTAQTITVGGVPLTATKVVLLTNVLKANKTYPAYVGSTLTSIKGFSFDIKDQQPAGGVSASLPIAYVVMSGEADITDTSVGTDIKGTANIKISPVLSRFEIKAVRCVTVSGTKLPGEFGEGQITKFRLNGVFIPNHYASGSVFGVGTGALVKPLNDATNNYYVTSFPAIPASSTAGYLRDYFDGENTLKKESTNFFAYHVFPANGAANIPNIVVAVDQVWFKDLDGTEKLWKGGAVQYFTVDKFKNRSADVSAFEAAKVYRIDGEDPATQSIDKGTGEPVSPGTSGSIVVTLPGGSGGVEFGLGDLTDKPYDKNKTVTCNITIMPWTVVTITPSK